MFGFGFQELLVVLAIILVLFGGRKIPELSRNFSDAIKQLRKGFSDDVSDASEKGKEDQPKKL